MTVLKSVDILGVRVHVLSEADLLSQVLAWSQQDQLHTITYANAYCVNVAQENRAYRDVLNQADLVYSDGIGVVWAARWLASVQLQKLTGRDWIDGLCSLALAHNLKLYFLGAKPGVAAKACANLQQRFPGLQIAAARDGFFTEMSEADVLVEINRLRPHVVLVGMGTPRQDLWLAANRSHIQVPICWSIGGFFDIMAGVEKPVPRWLNTLALEWLWRMLVDPQGKWRRYILGNPLFLLRIARKKLTQ